MKMLETGYMSVTFSFSSVNNMNSPISWHAVSTYTSWLPYLTKEKSYLKGQHALYSHPMYLRIDEKRQGNEESSCIERDIEQTRKSGTFLSYCGNYSLFAWCNYQVTPCFHIAYRITLESRDCLWENPCGLPSIDPATRNRLGLHMSSPWRSLPERRIRSPFLVRVASHRSGFISFMLRILLHSLDILYSLLISDFEMKICKPVFFFL